MKNLLNEAEWQLLQDAQAILNCIREDIEIVMAKADESTGSWRSAPWDFIDKIDEKGIHGCYIEGHDDGEYSLVTSSVSVDDLLNTKANMFKYEMVAQVVREERERDTTERGIANRREAYERLKKEFEEGGAATTGLAYYPPTPPTES